MIQVRNGVFETNSSSTNSIVICPNSEFDKWKSVEPQLDTGWYESNVDSQFLTKEQAIRLAENSDFPHEVNLREVSNDDLDWHLAEDYGVYSYEKYFDANDSLEYYEEPYTTQHGDGIVVFGFYGYDY